MAALVLVGLEGGWDGLARFLRRSLNPRVGWRWFAIAALIPPAMALTLVGLQAAAGHAPPLAALGAWHTHVAAFVVGTSGASPRRARCKAWRICLRRVRRRPRWW